MAFGTQQVFESCQTSSPENMGHCGVGTVVVERAIWIGVLTTGPCSKLAS